MGKQDGVLLLIVVGCAWIVASCQFPRIANAAERSTPEKDWLVSAEDGFYARFPSTPVTQVADGKDVRSKGYQAIEKEDSLVQMFSVQVTRYKDPATLTHISNMKGFLTLVLKSYADGFGVRVDPAVVREVTVIGKHPGLEFAFIYQVEGVPLHHKGVFFIYDGKLFRMAMTSTQSITGPLDKRYAEFVDSLILLSERSAQDPAPDAVKTAQSAQVGATTRLSSESRFATVRLPHGISLDLPKMWWLIGKDFNAIIETASEAALDSSGLRTPDETTVNLIAANSMPRTTYAAVRVDYITPRVGSPEELLALTPAELKELDKDMEAQLRSQGIELLNYLGTSVERLDGHPTMVTHIRRNRSDTGSDTGE